MQTAGNDIVGHSQSRPTTADQGMKSEEASSRQAGRDLNPLGWVPLALVVWALLFGIYEVVERTLLGDANPDLIYVLHIIRGTGTSFLLAGLVAWYILRRRAAPGPPAIGGLRTIVAETEAKDLIRQASWVVRLRWIAIGGVLLMTFLCKQVFGFISDFSALALVLIALTMAGYNALFSAYSPREPAVVRVAFAQVFLDLVALTLMIYFSGGIHNPFFLFYLFHIVIAGILLSKRDTYLVTLVACALFCGMVFFQELGIIPVFPLLRGPGQETMMHMAQDWLYLSGLLGAFVTTAGCTAYFTTTIMEKLRRRGIEILEASEIVSQERAKTEDIVRSVGAGFLILDLQDRIVWANEISKGWFGEDIIGRTCGSRLWQQDGHCRSCPMHNTPQEGGPVTHARSILLNGKQSYFLANCSPIRSRDGCVDQTLMLIQDITQMKEMEIQLVQAGKMAAVGQLAAGIAHEINNPLAVVASSAEILRDLKEHGRVAPDDKSDLVLKHLKKIGENVYRCKNIIENLLAFSRREEDGWMEVDVCALLEDTLHMLEGTRRANERELVREFSADGSPLGDGDSALRLVRSRPRQIQQVFLNLLMNAMDAIPPGGKVTVSARRRGDGVEIAVADNGKGIAPEHQGRVFEPFFTSKPVGKGTGLGLYLSHQIVESLHGKITVESWPGEGAVFRVWLPRDASLPGDGSGSQHVRVPAAPVTRG